MFTFIITLIIIASLLIILVVLAQNSKGGGLSSQFGGSGTSQVMGVKRTGDLLEKLTWGLAIAIMVLSLSAHIFVKEDLPATGVSSPALERAGEQTVQPPTMAPIPMESTDSTASDGAPE
jgi:preprotein translocase subunit SecG